MSKETKTSSDSDTTQAKVKALETFYDFLKHLTTLGTGSIIILSTFLEKLFSNPEWKILISITFGNFIVSTTISVIVMMMLPNAIANHGFEETEGNIAKIGIYVAIGTFIAGIISLTAFTVAPQGIVVNLATVF